MDVREMARSLLTSLTSTRLPSPDGTCSAEPGLAAAGIAEMSHGWLQPSARADHQRVQRCHRIGIDH